MIIIARTSDAPAGKRHHRPLHVLRREEARHAAARAATARRSPRSAISAGRPTSSPSTISASPAADMIGEEGQRLLLRHSGLETARAHTAARAIGLAQGALDDSIALRQRAPAVRPADLRLPGDPLQDRRDGDPDRGGAPAQLLRLRADRHRPALRQGSLDGEAVRLRDGRARVQRGHPDPSAARATPPCMPSSATGAMRGSPRSSRAPRRSRSASSPTACSAAGGTDEGLRPHRQDTTTSRTSRSARC